MSKRINSRRKGIDGELEFANLLKEHGFEDARRSQQYSGAGHTADVVGLSGIHIEVKRSETLNINNAVEQCHRDKKETELGIVAHRKNGTKWLVTMTFAEWIKLYKKGEEKNNG